MTGDFIQSVKKFTKDELKIDQGAPATAQSQSTMTPPDPTVSTDATRPVELTSVSTGSKRLSVWSGWPSPDARERDK